MKQRRLQQSKGWILALSLGCTSTAIHADPVSAIVGLILVEKASESQDTAGSVRPTPWRTLLADPELAALHRMRHPAVETCITRADAGDPVAGYHVRKIARFAGELDRAATDGRRHPALTELAYGRPAEAFRWCLRQAGTPRDNEYASLEDYAAAMMWVVRRSRIRAQLLAARADP